MRVQPTTMAGAPVVSGSHLEDLVRFFDEGTQLVTVPFPFPRGARSALETALAGGGWKQAVAIDGEGVPNEAVLRCLDPRDGLASGQLRAFVGRALEVVASLFGVDELGVRLVEATHPPCPRFHVDRVLARMVITLAGQGSEYLLGEVNREKLGHGAHGLPDEESGLMAPGAKIHRVQSDRLCLFKGEAWPGNEGRGLVHRSPPPNGLRRWLMTVDLL